MTDSLKTAKLQVRNRKSVKEWSNSLDLTSHGSSLLLKDTPKKFRSLAVNKAKIFKIYIYSQSRTKKSVKKLAKERPTVLYSDSLVSKDSAKKSRYLCYAQES